MAALSYVRGPRAVRSPLAGVFAVAVRAVLANARSCAATEEWALDLDTVHLNRVGLERVPVEYARRTLLARIDAATLNAALAVFGWCRVRHVAGRRGIAIDGKTLCGVWTAATAALYLIAALGHATGVVGGQPTVNAKLTEIPTARHLLTGFDAAGVAGCVITLDARLTRNDTAKTIVDASADYVFTVEDNQCPLC